jgi:hypothetical protein
MNSAVNEGSFDWALVQLSLGKEVRRTDWPADRLLFLDGHKIKTSDDYNVYSLEFKDIYPLGTWELFKP